ncbi:hypothetical protein M413DRAFT_388255 [Hebeloma cylindrosporum]|uniref:Uncharacterized protein n=1 Tax=Hebeloma cylindrosporum TaxID=76867 RepID=A0A0C3CJ64_HEBCY|nr:hypothetical protein M413DRAFT_388255 [Hebeloma cylindrosporum h7]
MVHLSPTHPSISFYCVACILLGISSLVTSLSNSCLRLFYFLSHLLPLLSWISSPSPFPSLFSTRPAIVVCWIHGIIPIIPCIRISVYAYIPLSRIPFHFPTLFATPLTFEILICRSHLDIAHLLRYFFQWLPPLFLFPFLCVCSFLSLLSFVLYPFASFPFLSDSSPFSGLSSFRIPNIPSVPRTIGPHPKIHGDSLDLLLLGVCT